MKESHQTQKSGGLSTQIIGNRSGSYTVIKTLGTSHNPGQVDQLVRPDSFEDQSSIRAI